MDNETLKKEWAWVVTVAINQTINKLSHIQTSKYDMF